MKIPFIYLFLIQLCALFKKFTNCLFELQRSFSQNEGISHFTFHVSLRNHIFRSNHATELCDTAYHYKGNRV